MHKCRVQDCHLAAITDLPHLTSLNIGIIHKDIANNLITQQGAHTLAMNFVHLKCLNICIAEVIQRAIPLAMRVSQKSAETIRLSLNLTSVKL
jgi:hypothetical protein